MNARAVAERTACLLVLSLMLGACGSSGPARSAGQSGAPQEAGLTDGGLSNPEGGILPNPDAGISRTDGGLQASTSFTLTSSQGGTALPFTIGLGFKKGDVPSTFALDLASAQVEVRRQWADGSVKHAIVSGSVDLTPGQPRVIKITGGAYSGGTALTCDDIKASAPGATVSFGSLGTVALSSVLASPVRTWLSGPEAVECHYRAQVGQDPSLRVSFHVRLYRAGRTFVRVVAENGYLDVPTMDKTYAPSVTIGGSVVFTAASLTSYAHTRWTAEGWIGGDPQITPKHDTQYLMASRLVPNYWNKTAASAALDALTQAYVPMKNGDYTPTMGDTGFQADIGILPNWDALFLTSGADPRAYRSVLANAKSIGSYPIVWRDSMDDLPVRPSARATWTVEGQNGGGATSLGAGSYSWDVAHHPSAGYLAYLLTGDYFYLEDMQFQSANAYLFNTSSAGAGTARVFGGQTRAVAWCTRTVGQLAGIAPTMDAALNDYQALLSNNGSHWAAVQAQPGASPLGFVYSYELSDGGYGPGLLGPWQENFFVQSYGHVSDLEPFADMSTWNGVRDGLYRFPVGLLGPAGTSNYCFTAASEYTIKVADVATGDLTQCYQSWGTVFQNTLGSANTSCGNTLAGASGGAPTAASTGFYGNLMPAIAYAVDHGAPGAMDAWSRLTGASNWPVVASSGFETTAVWGVVPRGF